MNQNQVSMLFMVLAIAPLIIKDWKDVYKKITK